MRRVPGTNSLTARQTSRTAKASMIMAETRISLKRQIGVSYRIINHDIMR